MVTYFNQNVNIYIKFIPLDGCINKFKTDMLHGEEKQIVYENILRIDQLIKEQFSNHVTIRKKVLGVVRVFITAYINRIILSRAQAQGYSEAKILEKICYHYSRIQSGEQMEFARLRKYCSKFDEFEQNMRKAKNNSNILEFILRTVNVPIEEKNQLLKGYIDEVIDAPNQTEVSVYDEIAYHDNIVNEPSKI